MSVINVGILEALLKLRDEMSPGLTVAAKNVEQFSSNARSAGMSLLPLSAAIAAAGTASLVMAGQFEASLTRFVSLAGVTKEELAGVKEHILALAPAVGIGPQALADGMMIISSTVSDTKVALQILDTAAKGSAAGLGDVKDVGRALTAVINSYGAANITAARAADILTKTVQDGGAEAKELAPVLANVVPLAAQLGISFEEVGANIATFTKLGVPAAEAVTSLSSVMTGLLHPTRHQTDALASINMTLSGLRQEIREKGLAAALTDLTQRFGENKEGLAQVFGRVEALRNMMGTAGQQAATYADEVKRVTESAGTLTGAFDAMKGTQVQTWNELTAKVQVLAIRLGDSLAPSFAKVMAAAQPLLDLLISMVKHFGDLPVPIQTVTIAALALVAAAGPLLMAIGSIGTGVSTLLSLGAALTGIEFGAIFAGIATGAEAAFAALGTAAATMAGAAAAAGLLGYAIGDLLRKIPAVAAAADKATSSIYQFFNGSNKEIEKGVDVTKSWTAEQRAALETFKAHQAETIAGLATKAQDTKATGDMSAATHVATLSAKELKAAQKALREETEQNSASFARSAKEYEAMVADLRKGIEENFVGKQDTLHEAIDKSMRDVAAWYVKAANEAAAHYAASFKGTLKSAFADLPQTIMSALQGGGDVLKSVGGMFGSKIFGAGSSLVKNLTGDLSNVFGKTIGGALGSVIPGLGTLLGTGIGSIAGKIFGSIFGGEAKKVAKMRDSFIDEAGGIDILRKNAEAAGVSLDALLKAKKVDDYKKAVQDLNAAFALHQTAVEDVQKAMDKYGITVDEMGPKWAKQELDKQAMELLKDYQLLIAAGADNVAVLTKMAPSMNEYVQQCIAAGIAIPESMRPMIEKMAEQGLLLDANGEKITDVSKLNFTKDLTEQVQSLIDSIKDLVDALLGIPKHVDTQINVATNYPGAPGANPGIPSSVQHPPTQEEIDRMRNEHHAAEGMHGWTDGPVRILAGEAGRERIDITPAGQTARGGGGQQSSGGNERPLVLRGNIIVNDKVMGEIITDVFRTNRARV